MKQAKKIPKRLLAMFLAVLMAVSLLPMGSVTAWAAVAGDGDETILIHSYAELETVAETVNKGEYYGGSTYRGKTLMLADDFPTDPTGKMTKHIGKNNSYSFRGTFDGNEKTVDVEISDTCDTGMFGYVYYGTVRNLKVTGTVSGDGNNSVGGVVGCAGYGATVSGCVSEVTVSNAYNAGGIVGKSDGSAVITDCTYAGSSVIGTGSVGGVVGWCQNGTVSGCTSSGDVTANGDSGYAGGVVGSCGGTVIGCSASGNITGKYYAGGVVGYASNKIANCCYADSNGCITAENGSSYVGGVVGYTSYQVRTCFCICNTISAGARAGGIAGNTSSEVTNSYAVVSSLTATGTNGCYGGIAGASASQVEYCYSNYQTPVGGSYIQLTECGQIVEGKVGETPLVELLNAHRPAGSAVWKATESENNGYPTLDIPDTSWYNANLDSFILSTGSELEGLAYQVGNGISFSGKTIRLSGDFDNAESPLVTPIGDGGNLFYGTFDGNGRVVTLAIEGGDCVGLFGTLYYGKVINVGVTGSVAGGWYAGGVVGKCGSDATVGNCFSTATVSGDQYVGGLVGYLEIGSGGVIENCYAVGDVTGTADYGALFGLRENSWYSGPVRDCYSKVYDANGTLIDDNKQVGAEGEKRDLVDALNAGCPSYGCTWEVNADVNDGYPTMKSRNLSWYVGSSPYTIENTEQLEIFAYLVNNGDTFEGKTVRLSDDFNDTTPLTTQIGIYQYINYDKQYGIFCGTFDGNGKTVTLKISNDSEDAVGMFGRVCNDGTVKNLTTVGEVTSTGESSKTGGVAGYCYSSGKIINCSSFATVKGTFNIGGIVGHIDYDGTVKNCTFSGNAIGTGELNIGGVVGFCGGEMANCCMSGTVTAEGSDCNVGGLVGYLEEASIRACYASGTVTAEGDCCYVGGLIGKADCSSVEYCYFSGASVSAEGDDCEVGGLVGYQDENDISSCYSTLSDALFEESENNHCYQIDGNKQVGPEGEKITLEAALNAGRYADDYRWKTVNGENDGYPVFVTPVITWYNPDQTAFVLSSTAELDGLAYLVATGNSFEGKTVTLSDEFDGSEALCVTIGKDYDHQFAGTFDGNGKTVKLNISKGMCAGMFGVVSESGTIMDTVTAGKVSVKSCAFTGGLTGENYGTILQCASSVDGIVTSNNDYSYSDIGGLVGYNRGSITDSFATGKVSVNIDYDDCYAGGLVGYNEGSITDSFATGEVSANNNDFCSVGGLVGYHDGYYDNVCISGSYATGNVTVDSDSYCCDIGGLVGYSDGDITDSYATGEVVGKINNEYDVECYAGGLVGYNSCYYDKGYISGSHATGNVLAEAILAETISAETESCSNAGGLVGFNSAYSISGSYATGNVTANTDENGYCVAGGLIGDTEYDGGIDTVNCYAIGDVTVTGGDCYAGGLIGWNSLDDSMNNCYATGSVSVTGTGNDDVYAGGLSGLNVGSISNCYYAFGTVSASATGTGNVAWGGLVGSNADSSDEDFGDIDCCYTDKETLRGIENGNITNSAKIDEDIKVNDTALKEALNTQVEALNTEDSSYALTWTEKSGFNNNYPYLAIHQHNYSFSVEDGSIIASCGDDCPAGECQTVTLEKPASLIYDNTAKTASISGSIDGVEGTVTYYSQNSSTAMEDDPLNAGSYTAKLTIGDFTAEISYTIDKATPSVTTYPTPSAITYGQTLANSTLSNGVGSAAGSFAWKDNKIAPAVSDSNSKEYTVVFTPDDGTNYNTVEFSVKLTVNKAQNRISDLTCADIKVGGTPAPKATALVGTPTYEYSKDGNTWNEDWSAVYDTDGTYYVRAKTAETANYDAAFSNPTTFKVEKEKDEVEQLVDTVIEVAEVVVNVMTKTVKAVVNVLKKLFR